MLNILAIALGAIPGALARFYLTEWCKTAIGRGFPYGTFLINLTGCLLMGFFVTLSAGVVNFPVELKLLFATGFLGSYTTFSTYEFDTLVLVQSGKFGSALFYWIGSILFGVLGLQLGDRLAQLLLV